jgi:hypothetical protein
MSSIMRPGLKPAVVAIDVWLGVTNETNMVEIKQIDAKTALDFRVLMAELLIIPICLFYHYVLSCCACEGVVGIFKVYMPAAS